MHYNSPAAVPTTPCDSRTSSDDQKKKTFSESLSVRSQNLSSKSGTTSQTLCPPSPSYMCKRKDLLYAPYEYGKEKKKPMTSLKDLKLNPLEKLAKSDPLE